MQVGTTEDQGLYNKPSAAVHPGALAAGTLPQYNTIPITRTGSIRCLSSEVKRLGRGADHSPASSCQD